MATKAELEARKRNLAKVRAEGLSNLEDEGNAVDNRLKIMFEPEPVAEVKKEKAPEPDKPKVEKPKKIKNPRGAGRKKQKEGNYKRIHVDVPEEMYNTLLEYAAEYTGDNLTKLANKIFEKYIKENSLED